MRRVAAWIAIGAAACGDGALAPDAAIDAPRAPRPDAGTPQLVEAADCGGAPLIPRQGRQLVVSALEVPSVAQTIDLNGDELPDNQLLHATAVLDSLPGLFNGTLAIPIEVFDHGADPDPCVKLALYAGTCASPPCNFTDGSTDTVALAASSIAGGAPVSRLRAMSTDASGRVAATGPGYLELPLPLAGFLTPFDDRVTFPFPLTVQYAAGTLGPAGLDGLHIAGVAQAFRLGQLLAPRIDAIGIAAGDTLLDAVFAGNFGYWYLNLIPVEPRCLLADVDLDGDGRERFCITNPTAHRVGLCIDGDGTKVFDGDNGLADCSQAMTHGVPRFPDGISIQVRLSAKPGAFTP
jgi:hypothetical protein